MINLFKGYATASDKEFIYYIKKKKDEYDEDKDFTSDQLMNIALNKYTNIVRDGEWNALSAEEKEIVALKASLEAFKKESLQLIKNLRHKENKRKLGKQGKGGEKAKGNGGKEKSKDVSWAWKKVLLSEGKPQVKKRDGKDYIWCKLYQAQVLHDLSEWKKNPEKNENKSQNERKISFTAKLSKILAQKDLNDDE